MRIIDDLNKTRLLLLQNPETEELGGRFREYASMNGRSLIRETVASEEKDSASFSDTAKELAATFGDKESSNPFMAAVSMNMSGGASGSSGKQSGQEEDPAAAIAALKKRIEELKRRLSEANETLQKAMQAKSGPGAQNGTESTTQATSGVDAGMALNAPSLSPVAENEGTDTEETDTASSSADTPSVTAARMAVVDLQNQLLELNKELSGAMMSQNMSGVSGQNINPASYGGTRARGGVGVIKGHIGTA